ncbi:MAG: glutaredoxin family protein [Azoarcus sp.]|nr:glutaredoxin family protein [Azoarcus sp.]
MSERARLYRMATPEHLCPFGLKSLHLLQRRGYEVDDHTLKTREAVDAFQAEHGVDTTPQTFIGDERIGGYDELREHFDLPPEGQGEITYTPIIAIFGVAFAMALAAAWNVDGSPFSLRVIEWFVAVSMCLLAIQKLRDLDAFSNQFVVYDLLAMRDVRYAYVYPFAEAWAGIGMLAGFNAWLVAPIALFIGTVGAVSVFKAVYVERRALKCACVGGGSSVPLGVVSLTENLFMIFAAFWMWLR